MLPKLSKGGNYTNKRDKTDNCPYVKSTNYTKVGCPIAYGHKRKAEPRLNATIIRLRKLGFAQQDIAKFVNRSRGHIHSLL